MGRTHLVIPDVQAKGDVDLSHLAWIGEYIMHKKPDVIVCLGDFADMPSLSSYDKGKKSFEGRRYKADIKAAKKAMDILLKPMREYNEKAVRLHKERYKPRMVLTLGNHEERIMRAVSLQAEFEGVISYEDLPYDDWEVFDYLNPVNIDGFCYVHFLANPMTGKPYAGTALSQLTKVGKSFVVGHKQTLDIATRFLLDGQQQWGFVAGASYLHDEDYKGYQGNAHWRGLLLLNDVRDGNCSPSIVDLDYLRREYGG
jgi:hypothetical protein